jgi:hypothetical protein
MRKKKRDVWGDVIIDPKRYTFAIIFAIFAFMVSVASCAFAIRVNFVLLDSQDIISKAAYLKSDRGVYAETWWSISHRKEGVPIQNVCYAENALVAMNKPDDILYRFQYIGGDGTMVDGVLRYRDLKPSHIELNDTETLIVTNLRENPDTY